MRCVCVLSGLCGGVLQTAVADDTQSSEFVGLWKGMDTLSDAESAALESLLLEPGSDHTGLLQIDRVSGRRPVIATHSVFKGFASNNKQAIQIVGGFNAGTNLLGALLELNLGTERMRALCPGSDEPGYNCLYWKSVPPKQLDVLMTTEVDLDRDLYVLAVVRSPLSQINTWVDSPLLEDSCADKARDPSLTWDNVTCMIPKVAGESFKGLGQLWSSYTKEYNKQGEWGRATVVEYERLVLEPEKVVEDIFSALGLAPPTPIRTFGKDGRKEASARIENKAYLNEAFFGNEENRRLFCARNRFSSSRLLNKVPTYPARSYSDDCPASARM